MTSPGIANIADAIVPPNFDASEPNTKELNQKSTKIIYESELEKERLSQHSSMHGYINRSNWQEKMEQSQNELLNLSFIPVNSWEYRIAFKRAMSPQLNLSDMDEKNQQEKLNNS